MDLKFIDRFSFDTSIPSSEKFKTKKGGKPNSSCVCNLCNLEQVETLFADDNKIIMAQLVGLLPNLKALHLAENGILSLIDQDKSLGNIEHLSFHCLNLLDLSRNHLLEERGSFGKDAKYSLVARLYILLDQFGITFNFPNIKVLDISYNNENRFRHKVKNDTQGSDASSKEFILLFNQNQNRSYLFKIKLLQIMHLEGNHIYDTHNILDFLSKFCPFLTEISLIHNEITSINVPKERFEIDLNAEGF